MRIKRISPVIFLLGSLLCAACSPAGGNESVVNGASTVESSNAPNKTLESVIQVRYVSSSDSANMTIRNPEIIKSYTTLESWGEPSRLSVSEAGIAIEQSAQHAAEGNEAGVLVEYEVASDVSPAEIEIVLEKSDLNKARMTIMDVSGPDPVVLEDYEHENTSQANDFNRTRLAVAVGVSVPAAAAQEIPAGTGETSSIIFYHGSILTMNSNKPIAQAVWIENDTIRAVGEQDEVFAMADEDAIKIDLGGRTLMPGFIDSHTHSFNNIWRDDFEAGQQFLLAHGITTSAELFVKDDLIQDFLSFNDSGQLRMRISLYPLRVDNCGEDLGEWYWPDYPVSREDGALLQIPGIKIISDGGSCNRPARSYPYPDGSLGDLYLDAQTLAGLIEQAQEHGYQVAIHGLGDRAITVNLDALEIVIAGGENSFHHRLEHNTLLSEDMFARYSEVNPVTVIFGFFPACTFESGKFVEQPAQYQQMEWAWRPLIEANPDVHFAWHSDSPWVGQPEPMTHIYGFVTRREMREDGSFCEPPAWATDDLLSVEEALPMMTIGSAYALRRDHEIGSIEPGKLADLIILSANPLEAETEDILDIQVLMSMVGGEVKHCLDENMELCP